MIAFLLLYQLALVSAFCTDLALWVPWIGETVDMAADALDLRNYEPFIELNSGLEPTFIIAGQTYTVPFKGVKPPATWVEIDGCTPLLELNREVTSSSNQETSKAEEMSTRPTWQSSSSSSIVNKEAIETSISETITSSSQGSTTAQPKTGTQAMSPVSQAPSSSTSSSTSQIGTHDTTSLSRKSISTYETSLSRYYKTANAPSSAMTASSTFKTSLLSTSKPLLASTTQSSPSSTFQSPPSSPASQTPSSSTSQTEKTAITSSSLSPNRCQYVTDSTDKNTLEKYAKAFCSEADGKSVTKDQYIQHVYLDYLEKVFYVLTVSWGPDCEGKGRTINNTGNFCLNTMMRDWRGCQNGDQDRGTIYDCLRWTYRTQYNSFFNLKKIVSSLYYISYKLLKHVIDKYQRIMQ